MRKTESIRGKFSIKTVVNEKGEYKNTSESKTAFESFVNGSDSLAFSSNSEIADLLSYVTINSSESLKFSNSNERNSDAREKFLLKLSRDPA